MKDRYIKILLTVIAINLTVITLNSVVDRFIPDAMAASIQKVAICDPHVITVCAGVAEMWGMGTYHLQVATH